MTRNTVNSGSTSPVYTLKEALSAAETYGQQEGDNRHGQLWAVCEAAQGLIPVAADLGSQ